MLWAYSMINRVIFIYRDICIHPSREEKKKIGIIAGAAIGGVMVVGIILVCVAYNWNQRAKSKEKTAALTAKMTGFDETEVGMLPLALSDFMI